jgi:hypothetical protein
MIGIEFGNGSCVDIDECMEPEKYPCNTDHANCINTKGSYECNCINGRVKGETNNECIDINECAADESPCATLTDSVCVNKEPTVFMKSRYTCQCASGFVFEQINKNKQICVDWDPGF